MSLVSLCIQTLLPFVDQIQLPYRLHLRSTTLDELIPDPAHIDTRLWAALIQIYDNLPPFLASHKTDTHLPLIQSIPSTPSFSLITLLELSSCPHLNDSSILELRFIHTVTAFDATESTLSPYAIKTLASFTGLWQLRILSLRNCRHITNDAFPHFAKFPLLSVLDLRGTRCDTRIDDASLPFQPSSHDLLYHPTPLKAALTTLHTLHSELYSSANPYFLHINALRPRPTHRLNIPTVTPQDAFFVIPSDNSKIQVGSSHLLEERERELAHQRNKDAWYERRELVESLSDYAMDSDLTRRPSRHVVESSATHIPSTSRITNSSRGVVESSARRIPSASRITNSSWIGASKHDPLKQNKSRHSLPLPSNALLTLNPQANGTSSNFSQSFYNTLPKRSSSLLSRRTPFSHDDHLKLYRPAPPWSTLNERLAQVRVEETAAMKRQERPSRIIPPEEEIARVDMSSTKATLVKRQLDEWALVQVQMHRDEKEKVANVRVMDAERNLLSRNPFRKQQQQGVTKSLKPLIPISTVKVPNLTPQVRKAALAREETESGLNLKRKRIETEANLTVKSSGPKQKNVTTSVMTSSGGFNWKGWSKNTS